MEKSLYQVPPVMLGLIPEKVSPTSLPYDSFVEEKLELAQLKKFYRSLCSCLDNVRELMLSVREPADQVCLVIIEDDINSLLDECSEYLLLEREIDDYRLFSLECRCETVLEELIAFMTTA